MGSKSKVNQHFEQPVTRSLCQIKEGAAAKDHQGGAVGHSSNNIRRHQHQLPGVSDPQELSPRR